MKFVRYILALGAFFVVAVALSACGSGVPGNAVADMAGNPISTQAFNHWMYVAAKGQASQSPGAPVIVPTDPPDYKGCIKQVRAQLPSFAKTATATIKKDCGDLFTSLSSQVMDFLIKAYWYQAQASAQHVKVTDAEVQKAFQTAKKQQFPTDAQFNAFLTQTGQTLSDIMFRVRVNQLYLKLLHKHNATVTDAQIQSYYQSHTSQFGTPESRDIRIVLTKTKAQAQAAKAALSHGQSWNAVAKKYSTDASTKNKGGQLTGITQGQEDPGLEAPAFKAAKGKVIGPVHGQFGWYVFEVTKITPKHQQMLAQATPLIRQTLMAQQQQSAQTAVEAQAKKAWLHKTTCRSSYSMADCNGYKAPKTSTAATPGATPPPTTTTH